MSSTDRVDKLTASDRRLLRQTRDYWRQAGLSTAPTDRVRAEAAVKQAYVAAGLEAPKLFIWLKSPWAGNTCVKLLASDIDWPWQLNTAQVTVWDDVWKQTLKPIEKMLGEAQWATTRKLLRQEADQKIMDKHGHLIEKQVRELFAENLGIYIWRYLRTLTGASVYKHIRESCEGAVKHALEARVSAEVADEIYHELVQPVHQQVFSFVSEPMRQQVPVMAGILAGQQRWDCGLGSHDAGWISYYDYLAKLGLPGTRALDGFRDMALNAGWWWPYEHVCIMTERPSSLQRDNRFRLHCEDAMAMSYNDGWGVFAWHGVLVPPYVVLLPEPLTFDLIENEPNAEVRRVLIERFGLENYLREGNVIKIQQDECGILYRMNLPSEEPIIVVRVKNSTPEPDGSIKEYFLRVPPQMVRARQAVAWTFGLNEDEYQPAIET
ncbi:MAG: hypothetical protein J0H83_15270 [Candidatus Melainabacteria bacterium]|jgi:hypothetical protein|nr:hypothetical protein [Candidatus Melainabacteria bacterium]